MSKSGVDAQHPIESPKVLCIQIRMAYSILPYYILPVHYVYYIISYSNRNSNCEGEKVLVNSKHVANKKMTNVTGLISTHSFLFLSQSRHQHTPHNLSLQQSNLSRSPLSQSRESFLCSFFSIILPFEQNPEVSSKESLEIFSLVCDIRVPLMNFKLKVG